LRALFLGLRVVVLPLVDGAGLNQRPHEYVWVQAIADANALHLFNVSSGEFRFDLLVDDDSAGRNAALTGRLESAENASVDRQFKVSVFENDRGVLAAHFRCRELEEVVCGDLLDVLTNRAGAGEKHSVNCFVLDQRIADGFAKAVDEVDDACRESGFVEQFHELVATDWRLLGGFEDDGVASENCGED